MAVPSGTPLSWISCALMPGPGTGIDSGSGSDPGNRNGIGIGIGQLTGEGVGEHTKLI